LRASCLPLGLRALVGSFSLRKKEEEEEEQDEC
jgi:hypothetical protein